MIPRLPPLLIAVIGGASIYGIKYMIDRTEPRALGAPGSHERALKMLQHKLNFQRLGIAAAVTGILYTGYWVYDSRQHRPSPAVIHKQSAEFYQDQYQERENRLSREREEMKRVQNEEERRKQRQSEQEVIAMKRVLSESNQIIK
ncbi:hypothetical protein BDB01DRAFT_832163 [Pilobolus umbonatus]|nr:hypothetical protein BDB01DRAFT_832163 [Pilobolus umbonatus]